MVTKFSVFVLGGFGGLCDARKRDPHRVVIYTYNIVIVFRYPGLHSNLPGSFPSEGCGSRSFCKEGGRKVREAILEGLVWFDHHERLAVERAQVDAYLGEVVQTFYDDAYGDERSLTSPLTAPLFPLERDRTSIRYATSCWRREKVLSIVSRSRM